MNISQQLQAQFQRRYWIFRSGEQSVSLGLQDFVGASDDFNEAMKLAKRGEWGAVTDCQTGQQWSIYDGKDIDGERTDITETTIRFVEELS